MAVWPHAQEYQIEARKFARLHDKEFADLFFVVRGRGIGVGILCVHAEYVRRRNRDLCQKRFVHHPVIALGVSRRHIALIAKEEKNAIPCEVGVVGGEQRIESLGRRTARQGDCKASLSADGGASKTDEFFSSSVKQIGGGGKDFNRARHRKL